MNNSVEITKAAFDRLVSLEHGPDKVENLELANKFYYGSPLGVSLLEIHNFVSNVTQYYIQDINA